jgi:hypothetical protein
MHNREEKPFSLVALDLDGTLYTSSYIITENTVNLLRTLHNQNVNIVVASGRMVEEILPIYSDILCIDNAFIIGYNGAVCVEIIKGTQCKELFNFSLPRESQEPLCSYCQHDKILLLIKEGKNYVLESFTDHEHLKQYVDVTKTPCEYAYINSYEETFQMDFTVGLIVCATEELADATLSELKELYANDNNVHVVKTHCANEYQEQFYVEVLNKKATKGHALEALCQKLDILPDKVIAFGDGENDLEMFKFAGTSVCMSNAALKLKEAATIISKYSNDQESVYMELKSFY